MNELAGSVRLFGRAMRPVDLPDTIDLAFVGIAPPDDDRREPSSAAISPDADFIEPKRLDPTRFDFLPEPKPSRSRTWPGSIGSLLLHLLPLLVLITWARPPLDIPPPIPIQLVIEPPPPPPKAEPKPPAPEEKLPPERRASDDFGVVGKAKPPAKGANAEPSTQGKQAPTAPQSPAEETSSPPAAAQPKQAAATPTHTAQSRPAAAPPEPPAAPIPQPVTPPPEPTGEPALQSRLVTAPPQPPTEQITKLVVALPEPSAPPIPDLVAPPLRPPPQIEQLAAATPPRPPKPNPVKPKPERPLFEPQGSILPLPLHPERRPVSVASARYPGPNATRDEYCAYALKLTMSHIDLLPLSLLGARHGDTVVTMHLAQDGTVLSARVVEGSGYEDIDERVAQMVRAVGRFPPLPSWLSGQPGDFTFRMHYPNPAQH
ncbi:MAG TPA: TonB family protein [Stellaceae bacterium]|nr:TonB family protein [Stellaceae bacterium]